MLDAFVDRLLALSAQYAEHGLCSGTVSVRPTVCLSWTHSSKPVAAGLLLWARRAGDIDQLLHCWRSAAAAYGGRMRAVARCQRTWVVGS